MNENKLVGFDPQIFKEQKQIVEAIIDNNGEDEEVEFEENIENMLDYLEENNDEEDEDIDYVEQEE